MAIYQLNRPDIETIIDYCNDLEAGEKLEVFEFGKDCDLVLQTGNCTGNWSEFLNTKIFILINIAVYKKVSSWGFLFYFLTEKSFYL